MSEEHKEQHGEGDSGGHGGGGHGGGGHGGGGAHGGGAHEEHEGAPEWLISFADNVALMMGFFVVLLAMNMASPKTGGIGGHEQFPSKTPVDDPAMQDFAIALRGAFNNPVDINSSDPREASLVKRLRDRQVGGDTTKPGPSGNKHDLQAVRPSDFTSIAGYITFPETTTTITTDSAHTIQVVADQLRGTRWMVEVRGHVSSLEAMRDKDKAVRLGFERAYAAAEELAKDGVSWEQMRIVSCADNERATPVAGDRAGHQNNQRAEIVVTQETMPPDPYSTSGSGVPRSEPKPGNEP